MQKIRTKRAKLNVTAVYSSRIHRTHQSQFVQILLLICNVGRWIWRAVKRQACTFFGPRVMCCCTRMVLGYMMYLGVLKAFVVHISCMVSLSAVRNRQHNDRNGSVFSFSVYTYFGIER